MPPTRMTANETARRVPTPITDAAPKAYKYRNLSTGLIYEDPFGRDEWETLVFVELATCQQLEQENAALREQLESAIMDFRKLAPFVGEAAEATANLYETRLKNICSHT